MTTRFAFRLTFVALLAFAAPLLFAGPVGPPDPGIERFVVYYSCATGSPVYTGYEQWDCEGDRHSGGNITSNRAVVSDSDCETFVSEDLVYFCRTPSGAWRQISSAEFYSCHVCADIGG